MEALALLGAVVAFIGVIYLIIWWLYIRPLKQEPRRQPLTRSEVIDVGTGAFDMLV